MKKLTLFIIILGTILVSNAQELAMDAVKNMRIGWNVGNRLDSNSGDVENMWIEAWTDKSTSAYETAWGQPVITRELIHMFKEAGFNAIRVPVTWYPHMGKVEVNVGPNANGEWRGVWNTASWTSYDVDPVWMARVRQVVDYVIDEGMYCLLNVHHDTGGSNTAWLRADMETYNSQRERFENLWTQIATEFGDYDDHLLFEGYNEMLDKYGSWCFASFAAPGNYNAADAKDTYQAINSYAQSFVDAVRATGGKNLTRNLVVNTYAACCGEGTWNSHLKDPLKEMQVPTDVTDGHLIVEVHSYPSPSSASAVKKTVDDLMSALNQHIKSKGVPVVLGEWGTMLDSSAANYNAMFCELARYLVKRAKEEDIATFIWMVLADGADCEVPKWSNEELKDAIIYGYYGEDGYQAGVSIINIDDDPTEAPIYNLQGIKVQSPTLPGIYIQSNKKMLIK